MIDHNLLTQVELFKPFANYKVEFGEYILLNISMGSIRVPEYPPNWKNESHHGANYPFYWNVESKNCYIEIEIGNPSGIFIDFNIILFLGQFNNFFDFTNVIETKSIGIPNFSISLWNFNGNPDDIRQNILSLDYDVEIQLGEDALRVKFCEDEIKHLIELPDRIIFELNKFRQLCSVTISNLTSDEIKLLKEYEAFHKSIE